MANDGQFQQGVARTYSKVCVECDKPFTATSGRQRKCQACRSCEWCGAELRYSHQRFCGQSCSGKWKASNCEAVARALADGRRHPNRGLGISRYRTGRPRPDMRAENNWNWKGGTYGTIRHTQMSRAEYKAWRLAVFKRDGFTCVLCQRVGVRLQAHHIHPWRSSPERWFDVSNGVALCGSCHRGIGNREEDFIERFDRHVRTSEPVELTGDERSRFMPFVTACATCRKALVRPRWHRKKRLHFCDMACKRRFEGKIGNDWRGYTAGRVTPSSAP